MADPVAYEAKGALVRVTIQRPEVKNALNLEALQALIAALERANREPAARLVVLAGAGGDLSAGGDIQDMIARRGKAVVTAERLKQGLSRIVELIATHERPVLARIDGDAVGAGAAVAIACDVVLATKRSRLGFPFVKVGLVPDTGSSYVLPRVAGLMAARRLLLTGDLVGAEEAHRLGLVTSVVADAAALDAEEGAWVERFSKLPPTAVRDAKRLLWGHLDVPRAHALVNEAFAQGIRFTTPEHAQAVDAFLAKRGSR